VRRDVNQLGSKSTTHAGYVVSMETSYVPSPRDDNNVMRYCLR